MLPGKTVCFECLAAALTDNRWLQEAVGLRQHFGYLPQPAVAALPSTIAIACGMIATVVAVYLATVTYLSLENTIMTLDTRTMVCSYSEIRNRQDCPECGSVRPGHDLDGLQALISPLTGIVSRVEITQTKQAGLFHAAGSFIHPRCPSYDRPALKNGYSSGKGCMQTMRRLHALQKPSNAIALHTRKLRSMPTMSRHVTEFNPTMCCYLAPNNFGLVFLGIGFIAKPSGYPKNSHLPAT